MKNFFYSLMTFAAVASALVSCSREEVEVKDNNEFVYRFEIAEGTTKATLDQEGVWWEVEKDKVGVIVDGENIQADVVESDGKKVISFTRETAIDAGTPIYSYYPYSEAVTSAESARVTIPTEQEGASVSAMPMAGIPITLESEAGAPSSGKINFLNLGAIIDFRIYSTNADYANETVESVTFKSDSDAAKASGTATIDLTGVQGGENPSVPTIAFGDLPSYRRATVTQSVSVAASKDAATTPMYLVVAPGTFSGTVTVNTNAASYTFEFTNKILARNTITKFNMNIGSSKAEREAMTKTYEYTNSLSEDGVYLIAGKEDTNGGLFVGLFGDSVKDTTTAKYGAGQKINDINFSTNSTESRITTSYALIINSEIKLKKASDNNWLMQIIKTGKYITPGNENYRVVLVDTAPETGYVLGSGTSSVSLKSGDYYFFHSGTFKGFTHRTNSSGSNNLRFYKYSGSTKSQTLSFEGVPEDGIPWDLASSEPFAEPNLVGAKTTVTYTSSNENIAQVDAVSGEITFGTKTGTVTITASAAGMDGYASAEASYMISVFDSTPHQQNLSFSPEEITFDMNGSIPFAHPDLTGAFTDVTYSSSNPDVATFDEAGKIISFVNAGTTIITATASSGVVDGTTYEEGSASYTLNVTKSEFYYKRVEAEPSNWEGVYLFVDETNSKAFAALSDNASTYDASIIVDVENGIILSTAGIARYELKVFDTGANHLRVSSQRAYDLQNSEGKHIFRKSAGLQITESHDDTPYYHAFKYDNGGVQVLCTKNSTSTNGSIYYLGYSNGFVYTSGATSNRVQLYQRVTGTPKSGQTISFIGEDETVTLGTNCSLGSYIALHGVEQSDGHTTVSYDTSNPDVAVIELVDDTYKVKLVGAGTTDIIATAAENDTYYSATASYQLTINKASQTISFDGEDETVTLGTTYQLGSYIALHPVQQSEDHSEVSYSTSNPNVAIVEQEGGTYKVKIVGAGTTEVIATAIETATFNEATDSYVLTIVDPNKVYYNKINAINDIEDGARYLIVRENGSKAFKPVLNGSSFVSGNTQNAVDVTIEDSRIEAIPSLVDCQVILEKYSESNYYIIVPQSEGSNLYLVPTRSGSNWNYSYTFAAQSTAQSTGITLINSAFNIGGNNAFINYNSNAFRAYSSASSMALYMLDDGQPKDRNLAFSKDEITVSIYGKTEDFVLTNAPVLSGKKLDDVTYSSSNPNVATVNATTGEVTIKRVEGTATITASADPTPEGTTPAYLADEASYTITVIDEKIYYKKINSRDDLPGTTETSATGNYLFVYENGDKAFVFKAICDGTPTGRGDENTGHVELTKSGSAIEVDLTADGIEATDAVKDCQLQLAHHTTASRNDWNIKPVRLGTYWIRINNDRTNGLRILAMTSAGYSATYTFEGTGNNVEIKRTDSSRTAYWSYNATDNCFEATATASKISIYKMAE